MQDLQDLHGHILEPRVEMHPILFLCNNRLAEHGLVVAMMMTMILDLRLAALVQDTVTRLHLHMTVVVMIVLDVRLAAVVHIQGLLHTALDHQDFIILLPQVLVRLE